MAMNFVINLKKILCGVFAIFWIEGSFGQDVNVKVQQGTLMGVSEKSLWIFVNFCSIFEGGIEGAYKKSLNFSMTDSLRIKFCSNAF
jgi:hypothetical protein